jgi:hypothetical protein
MCFVEFSHLYIPMASSTAPPPTTLTAQASSPALVEAAKRQAAYAAVDEFVRDNMVYRGISYSLPIY